MNATELVNEAGNQTVLQWESLIAQLQKGENISNDEARRKIAFAFIKWRKNRPDTVALRVLRSIAFGLPKPKDLAYTKEDWIMNNVEYVDDPDGWYWHTDNAFCGPFKTKQEAIESYEQELETTDQDQD